MQLNLSLRSRLLLAGLAVLCLALLLLVVVERYLLNSTHDELMREVVIACVLALALTGVLTMMLYAWLTRGLRRLADASARLAAGDLTVRMPAQSDRANDEIGKLGAAFNSMAEALSSRIEALARGEAKFTAIADYSYDCELWADTSGKLIWINPRVQEMFGYTPEECLAAQDFPAPFVSDPDVNRTVRQIRLAVLGNTAVGNGGFEGDMDAGIPGDTPRVLTLGAANVPQSLTTSTFNNQSEARKITVRVDMSIQQQAGNFNPSTGTVKVGGTFNGWTAASLVAQGNGIYAGEFLVDGPLSAVEYKFMNGDTYESISNRTITVALTNLAASTLDPVYFNNHDVAVAASTFAGAYPGKSMTDVAPNGLTYLANYAFGGDSNTQPILPVQDMSDPDKLRLIVVYRTDDPTLPLSGLRGEATTSLSGAWDLPDVSVTDGVRTGLPDNLTRKVISVDRGTASKKFLRATVTR